MAMAAPLGLLGVGSTLDTMSRPLPQASTVMPSWWSERYHISPLMSSPRRFIWNGVPAAKIKEIADLAGHRVGIIGRTPANAALLRVVLSAAGVEADKVAMTHFG